METSELLRRARAILAVPETWIQGFYALDGERHTVRPNNPVACHFCAMGALLRARSEVPDKISQDPALVKAAEAICDAVAMPYRVDAGRDVHDALIAWNDQSDTSVTDVLEAFDRAIRALEAKKLPT